jgi:hypothetical protein
MMYNHKVHKPIFIIHAVKGQTLYRRGNVKVIKSVLKTSRRSFITAIEQFVVETY